MDTSPKDAAQDGLGVVVTPGSSTIEGDSISDESHKAIAMADGNMSPANPKRPPPPPLLQPDRKAAPQNVISERQQLKQLLKITAGANHGSNSHPNEAKTSSSFVDEDLALAFASSKAKTKGGGGGKHKRKVPGATSTADAPAFITNHLPMQAEQPSSRPQPQASALEDEASEQPPTLPTLPTPPVASLPPQWPFQNEIPSQLSPNLNPLVVSSLPSQARTDQSFESSESSEDASAAKVLPRPQQSVKSPQRPQQSVSL